MGKTGRLRELPVDRGWAWMVCFASFFCMFLTGSGMQVLSVLFLELVIEFESSVTITSLTVMCFVMSVSVSSVISTSVLVPLFGERPVIVAAGIMFSSLSIGYFLAPNIALFIAFSAGKGVCMGMIFVPSITLLSHYFDRRRSLATTIANSGICVASIVSPPVIRAIAKEFGLRGTFLVLSAVELHMVAAGLVMRPVSSYKKVPPKKPPGHGASDEEKASLMKDKSDTMNQNTQLENHSNKEVNQKTKPSKHSKHNSDNSVPINGTPSNRDLDNNIDNDANDISQSEKKELFAEGDLDSRRHSESGTVASRKGSVGRKSQHGSAWSVENVNREKVPHHASMLSVTSGMEPAVAGVGLAGEEGEKGWKTCCCVAILMRIFDRRLFSQWSYRIFLISCIPSATVQYLMQYIPTIAVIKGATRDQGATLMTIIGSVDLVSRLAIGVFADTHILKPTQIVAISQICLGIICQFNPLFDNFEKLIAMVVFMGLFIGTRQSMIAMMHIEIVGIEKMARCLSITAMLATISAASHSPMLSAVMEATGSYNIVLHYVGAALIVGALILLPLPLLARVDARREAKTKEGQS